MKSEHIVSHSSHYASQFHDIELFAVNASHLLLVIVMMLAKLQANTT